MYLDIIIVIGLLVLVLLVFRKFSSFVYAVAIIDIFLRILAFLKTHIPIDEFSSFIHRYFPSSIGTIITKYSSGILKDILLWGFVILYMIFLSYVVKTFIKKKK